MELSEIDMDLVCVIWEDSAHIHYGWTPLENIEDEFEEHVICVSVGILLHETDDHIVIAQSSDTERTAVSNTLKIPKISVKEVKQLKESKQPPTKPRK